MCAAKNLSEFFRAIQIFGSGHKKAALHPIPTNEIRNMEPL
jgi:hypothetical protein